MNSEIRINNILEGLKGEKIGIALLQGTRLRPSGRNSGLDVWQRCGCIVVLFGHDGDPDNVPASVAIILNSDIFNISDIVRVEARALRGRVEYIRLKRRDFDANFTSAYPPPPTGPEG